MQFGCFMFYENITSLYKHYDTLLIDMYGVLWDGGNFFDGVLDLLVEIKSAGKNVIILSNTTLTLSKCCEKYQPKGLYKGTHFDAFVSSGESFKCTLSKHIGGAKTYFSAFSHNADIFEGSPFAQTDEIEKTDFVYVGNLNSQKIYCVDELRRKDGNLIPMENLTSLDYHDIAGFEEIAETLDECLTHRKKLVVVNPDIFAIEVIVNHGLSQQRPVLCQGAIGELYENAGGEVIYFGKPYSAIFEFAKQYIPHGAKVAMVGDTLWTDILGGNIAGYATILTLSGVVGQFIQNNKLDNVSYNTMIDACLQTISPKMTHKSLANYSQMPTHIIKQFA